MNWIKESANDRTKLDSLTGFRRKQPRQSDENEEMKTDGCDYLGLLL
jgi:hypothetical protein